VFAASSKVSTHEDLQANPGEELPLAFHHGSSGEPAVKIAFCSPVDIHSLAKFYGQPPQGIPAGMGNTAATPLVLELLRRGHEVDVYTLDRDLALEEVYRWGNLRLFVGPCRQRHRARNFFRTEIDYLARVIRKSHPRFVHAHWTYEFALGAVRSGIPTLTTVHDLPWKVLWHFRDPYRLVRLMMAYQVAASGAHFTAVSSDAAEHFRRYFHPKRKVSVIPNGLSDTVFHLGEKQFQPVRKGVVFATVLQGWTRQKNPVAALKAFAIVRREIPDARLIMFGTGYEPGGPAQRWATRHKLVTDVTFAGPVEYEILLARLRDEVDVVIHPSLDESFSMVAAEAMALKKPVVAGKKTTGVREVLDFGRSGVLVDVNDSDAFAQEMVRLGRDLGYRDRVAQSGFERAASQFRLGTVVTQYEGLYGRLFHDCAVPCADFVSK
jgi:L-malate glycosyltransferase